MSNTAEDVLGDVYVDPVAPPERAPDRSTSASEPAPTSSPSHGQDAEATAREEGIANLNGWLQFGLYAGWAIRPDLGDEVGASSRCELGGAHWGWGIRAGLARALSANFGLEFALLYFRASLGSAQGEGFVLSKDSSMSFIDLDILLHVLPKKQFPLSVYGLLAIGAVKQSLGMDNVESGHGVPESRVGGAVGFGLGIRYFPFRHLSFDLQVRYEMTGFSSTTPCGEYTPDGKYCYLDESKEEDHAYGSTLVLLGPVATFW